MRIETVDGVLSAAEGVARAMMAQGAGADWSGWQVEAYDAKALRLAERVAPPGPGQRVTAIAPRRVDFDGWDPGDPE